MSERVATAPDTVTILNALPANCLVLLPDAPRFTIVAVTDAYLQATFTTREAIVGRGLFDVFPDSPHLPSATGVKNLQASLNSVLRHKQEHRMAEQRYDVVNPEVGEFTYKVWRPLNKPLLDDRGEVQYIIHYVEDITEKVIGREQVKQREAAEADAKSFLESNRFMEQVMEATPDFITVFNLQTGKVEFINRSGYKDDEERYSETLQIDYEQILQRAHPDDRAGLHQYIEGFRTLKDDEVRLFEYRVVRAGQEMWYRARGKVFKRNSEGAPTHYISILTDITEYRKAEQALKVSREQLEEEHYFLEQVTDKSPHLIYVFDLNEQRFTYINKRVEQLVGRDQEYVYAMGPHLFQAIIHPADLSKRAAYMVNLATLNEQEIRDHEFRIWTGNGFRWFCSKDSIFKKEDGVVKQVIGMAEDITYEKMMQEKIQREGSQMGLN